MSEPVLGKLDGVEAVASKIIGTSASMCHGEAENAEPNSDGVSGTIAHY